MAYPSALTPGYTLLGAALGAGQAAGSTGGATKALQALGTWAGRPMEAMTDYVGGALRAGSWDYRTPAYAGFTGLQVWSIGMLPSTGLDGTPGNYDALLRGDYDSLIDLAAVKMAAVAPKGVARIGWELQGNWFRWGRPDPAVFRAAWRRWTTRMIAAGFKGYFEHNTGLWNGFDPEATLPDCNVHFYGTDPYATTGYANTADLWVAWQRDQLPALDRIASLAERDGKRIAISEFGPMFRTDGYGTGDNPIYVHLMADWIASHDVAYANWFNDNDKAPDGSVQNRCQLAVPQGPTGPFVDSVFFPGSINALRSFYGQARFSRAA